MDGATVLITGATSGIGREMARQLGPVASRLILVARRRERLVSLQREISERHDSVDVAVEQCDLADEGEVSALLRRLASGPPVHSLINNAGVGDVDSFAAQNWPVVANMIRANVQGLTQLTLGLLPSMVSRGFGGVLNVSSGLGFHFLPGMAVYSATKHFVTALTEAIRLELAGTGVVVSQLCPGPVDTEFHGIARLPEDIARPKWVELSPAQCASEGLKGFRKGKAVTVPGRIMRVALWFSAFAPRWLQRLSLAAMGRRFAPARGLDSGL